MKLTNPYRGLNEADPTVNRLTVNVDLRDVHTIRTCFLDRSSVPTIVGMFIKHLATYVRQHSIIGPDDPALTDYICTVCHLCPVDNGGAEQRPTNLPPGQRPDHDDRAGVGRVCEAGAGEANVATVSGGEQTHTRAGTEGAKRKGKSAKRG